MPDVNHPNAIDKRRRLTSENFIGEMLLPTTGEKLVDLPEAF